MTEQARQFDSIVAAIETLSLASQEAAKETAKQLAQLAQQGKNSHTTSISRNTIGEKMQDIEQLKSTMFSGNGEGDYKDVPDLVKTAMQQYEETNPTSTHLQREFRQNAVIIEHAIDRLLKEALPNMVLFNTETEGWLKYDAGGAKKLKPDVTIGPQVVFKPTNRKDSKRDFFWPDGNYGKLIWGLHDACLLVMDGKVVEDNEFPDEESVGQLGDYLAWLANHLPNRKVHYGVLFYASGFTTFKYLSEGITRWKGQRGNWGDKRSGPYLIGYLKECYHNLPDWAKAASVLSTHFDTSSSKFLGRGRDGCVFELENKDSCGQKSRTVAVKVGNSQQMNFEFKRYEAIAEKRIIELTVTAKECIVLRPPDTVVDKEQSALVLNEVGTPLDRISITKEEVIECYMNLLNASGICQGDPRPENLVEYGGKFLWVDFTRSADQSKEKITLDMNIINDAYK